MITTSRFHKYKGCKERICFLLFNGMPLLLPLNSYTTEATYATISDSRVTAKIEQTKLTFIRKDIASLLEMADKKVSKLGNNNKYYAPFLSLHGKFAVISPRPIPENNERFVLILKVDNYDFSSIELNKMNLTGLIERWLLVGAINLVGDVNLEINKKLMVLLFC